MRTQTAPRPLQQRRVRRAATVAATVLAALAVWAFITAVLDVDIRSPEMGDDPAADIGFLHVFIASTAAAGLGWATLAGLERLTRLGGRIWVATAAAVLALSLGAPLTGDGITTADRLALVSLHLTVAAVLVPGLYPTTSRSRRDSR